MLDFEPSVRATTGDSSVKSGLGRRKILSITIYNKGGRKYLLTCAEGRSLRNKLRITCPGVTSFMFPHMTRHVTERGEVSRLEELRRQDWTSSGGSGGLGRRNTGPGPRIRTGRRSGPGAWRPEDGGRRSRANAQGKLVDPMNEEGTTGGRPEVPEVRRAQSLGLGSRKTESGRQDAGGREGQERMYYAKATVSGMSLYGSRPHPGDRAYGGSGGPRRMSGAEEGKGSDMVTVARSGE
ncbi:hypothetical protein K438DRAFT_1783881 [Mycena galopus ATCC 62051]|nr:hypothetical protein K438DRAFT_1783881 [Mycena galopus ATCC 62051]